MKLNIKYQANRLEGNCLILYNLKHKSGDNETKMNLTPQIKNSCHKDVYYEMRSFCIYDLCFSIFGYDASVKYSKESVLHAPSHSQSRSREKPLSGDQWC